jgi:hypothetical protein
MISQSFLTLGGRGLKNHLNVDLIEVGLMGSFSSTPSVRGEAAPEGCVPGTPYAILRGSNLFFPASSQLKRCRDLTLLFFLIF